MTASRDPDRLIHGFLLEGEEQLQDQVYDAVRAEIEQKRQRAVSGLWRTPTMNKFVTIGLGAAAVVVLLLVGVQLLGSGGSGFGDAPSPSPEASVAEPTATPEPSVAEPASTPDAGLPQGPFSFEPDGSFSPQDSAMTLTVTIPASGWGFDDTWNLLGPGGPEDAPFIAFWAFPDEQFYVPADPCRGDSTKPETPATTVDEIATALAAQTSRNASEPVDVMIGGYAGKSLILHAPEGVDDTDCERGEVITYFTADDFFWRNVQRSDEVSELWILDVDGTTVIIDAVSSPGNPTELVDETRTAVESTTFEFP
jgi:hypothetical protein